MRLQTDLAWRWFVGLSVLHPIPDVSPLSYFRKRLGVALFETILADVILACDAAGLIRQVEAYFDMTGIEASATQVTPYQRAVILAKALSAYLETAPASGGGLSQEQLAALALEALQEMPPSRPARIMPLSSRRSKTAWAKAATSTSPTARNTAHRYGKPSISFLRCSTPWS